MLVVTLPLLAFRAATLASLREPGSETGLGAGCCDGAADDAAAASTFGVLELRGLPVPLTANDDEFRSSATAATSDAAIGGAAGCG
jgi:hypothetical protein